MGTCTSTIVHASGRRPATRGSPRRARVVADQTRTFQSPVAGPATLTSRHEALLFPFAAPPRRARSRPLDEVARRAGRARRLEVGVAHLQRGARCFPNGGFAGGNGNSPVAAFTCHLGPSPLWLPLRAAVLGIRAADAEVRAVGRRASAAAARAQREEAVLEPALSRSARSVARRPLLRPEERGAVDRVLVRASTRSSPIACRRPRAGGRARACRRCSRPRSWPVPRGRRRSRRDRRFVRMLSEPRCPGEARDRHRGAERDDAARGVIVHRRTQALLLVIVRREIVQVLSRARSPDDPQPVRHVPGIARWSRAEREIGIAVVRPGTSVSSPRRSDRRARLIVP